MKVKTLGLRVQELETGPYTFLLVDSIPVAYRDRSPEAPGPGVFKTERRFNKAATRAENKWLHGLPFKVVSHDQIEEVFRSVSKFGESEPQERRNQFGRREEDRDVMAFVGRFQEKLERAG